MIAVLQAVDFPAKGFQQTFPPPPTAAGIIKHCDFCLLTHGKQIRRIMPKSFAHQHSLRLPPTHSRYEVSVDWVKEFEKQKIFEM